MSNDTKSLISFDSKESVEPWRAVDDSVMGGVSSSQMIWNETHASFKGVVSPDNNGGFASVRALVAQPKSNDADHLWIEAKGDGQLYAILLRTTRTPRGVSYQADFRSTSSFARIEIPLTDFVAQFRGRIINDAPELLASEVRLLGIMISDGQYGEFQLDVKAIGIDKL